ncbi:MAG: hypothetical protein EON61_23470, partial [Alphaproteobacteria bacterium]
KFVLDELSRIARRVIVSFRNYGHWRVRTALLTTGRIPNLGHTVGWWSDGARPTPRSIRLNPSTGC